MKIRIAVIVLGGLVVASSGAAGWLCEQHNDNWMHAHSKTPAIWRQQAEWHFATVEPQPPAWAYGADGFYQLPYCEDIGPTGTCVYRHPPKELQ